VPELDDCLTLNESIIQFILKRFAVRIHPPLGAKNRHRVGVTPVRANLQLRDRLIEEDQTLPDRLRVLKEVKKIVTFWAPYLRNRRLSW
jgi:hypothetical protein